MALRTKPRRRHGVLRLKTAAPALDLKNRHPLHRRFERVVRGECPLRPKFFHANGHITLLIPRPYSYWCPMQESIIAISVPRSHLSSLTAPFRAFIGSVGRKAFERPQRCHKCRRLVTSLCHPLSPHCHAPVTTSPATDLMFFSMFS